MTDYPNLLNKLDNELQALLSGEKASADEDRHAGNSDDPAPTSALARVPRSPDQDEDTEDSDATAQEIMRLSCTNKKQSKKKRKRKKKSNYPSKAPPEVHAATAKKSKTDHKTITNPQDSKTEGTVDPQATQAPPPTNTSATPTIPLSVQVILEGVDGGTQPCGFVTCTGIINGTDTVPEDLCIRGILTVKGDVPEPILVPFIAYWGVHLKMAFYAQPDDLVQCVKVQLARFHPVKDYVKDDYATLASKMILVVEVEDENQLVLKDDKEIGEFLTVPNSAQEPFSNEIAIKIEGREPPTLTTSLRESLVESCENATFRPEDVTTIPGIIEATDDKHEDRWGFALLAMPGEEKLRVGRFGFHPVSG